MDDKKAVHPANPNIEVVKHHKDSLPSWDELKYFIRKYYLFLLIIALIPVVLFTLGQQLANRGSAAPRLQLNSGAKVGVQTDGDANKHLCEGVTCQPIGKIECQAQGGYNTGMSLECVIKDWNSGSSCYETIWAFHDPDNSTVYDPKCPRISPTPPPESNKCSPGDQKIADLNHCGSNPDGSNATCSVCQSNGTWSGSWNLDCPDNARVARICMTYGEFPTPTSIPYYGGVAPATDVPQGGGGGGNCGTTNNGSWVDCQGGDTAPNGSWGRTLWNCIDGGWVKHENNPTCVQK